MPATKSTRRQTPAQRRNGQKTTKIKAKTCKPSKSRGKATERFQKAPAESTRSATRSQAKRGQSPRGRGKDPRRSPSRDSLVTGSRRQRRSSLPESCGKSQVPRGQRRSQWDTQASATPCQSSKPCRGRKSSRGSTGRKAASRQRNTKRKPSGIKDPTCDEEHEKVENGNDEEISTNRRQTDGDVPSNFKEQRVELNDAKEDSSLEADLPECNDTPGDAAQHSCDGVLVEDAQTVSRNSEGDLNQVTGVTVCDDNDGQPSSDRSKGLTSLGVHGGNEENDTTSVTGDELDHVDSGGKQDGGCTVQQEEDVLLGMNENRADESGSVVTERKNEINHKKRKSLEVEKLVERQSETLEEKKKISVGLEKGETEDSGRTKKQVSTSPATYQTSTPSCQTPDPPHCNTGPTAQSGTPAHVLMVFNATTSNPTKAPFTSDPCEPEAVRKATTDIQPTVHGAKPQLQGSLASKIPDAVPKVQTVIVKRSMPVIVCRDSLKPIAKESSNNESHPQQNLVVRSGGKGQGFTPTETKNGELNQESRDCTSQKASVLSLSLATLLGTDVPVAKCEPNIEVSVQVPMREKDLVPKISTHLDSSSTFSCSSESTRSSFSFDTESETGYAEAGLGSGSSGTSLKPQRKERRKRSRCGTCEPCLRKINCGQCSCCLNRRTGHQICKLRKCVELKRRRTSSLISRCDVQVRHDWFSMNSSYTVFLI